MISVFIQYLTCFTLFDTVYNVYVILENSDLFWKRVLCLLGSILCLVKCPCWFTISLKAVLVC